MENLVPEALYNQLFEEFGRFKRPIELPLRNDFIERSTVLRFRQKDIISDIDPQFKTSYYFIISGLVMSSRKFETRSFVDWIKGEFGYMFAIDMGDGWSDETIVALEDVVAIRISAYDLTWLEFNHLGFGMTILAYHDFHRMVTLAREAHEKAEYGPEDRYDGLQRVHNFSFDRVSDTYLAAYLNITLKELDAVRRKAK
jgi:hypothetical protein